MPNDAPTDPGFWQQQVIVQLDRRLTGMQRELNERSEAIQSEVRANGRTFEKRLDKIDRSLARQQGRASMFGAMAGLIASLPAAVWAFVKVIGR